MAIGSPDWGIYSNRSQVSTGADAGELAARLGSFDVFSRSGNVLFMSGFENGFGEWETEVSGTGAAITLDTSIVYSGDAAAKLVGGSNSGRSALLRKQLLVPTASKVGAEWLFALGSQLTSISIQIEYRDGSRQYLAEIILDYASSIVKYLGSDGDYHTITPVPPKVTDAALFYNLKLVVDFVSLKYTRLIINGVSTDLSSFSVRNQSAATASEIINRFILTSRSGQNDLLRVDNFIFTMNEP